MEFRVHHSGLNIDSGARPTHEFASMHTDKPLETVRNVVTGAWFRVGRLGFGFRDDGLGFWG